MVRHLLAAATDIRFTCLVLLLSAVQLEATTAQRSVPFSTDKSYDCINECIDRGYVFCPDELFGFCCEESRCGDTSTCSNVNRNQGARYLSCLTDDFCGQREHIGQEKKMQLQMDNDKLSPASACIYSFGFPTTANLGDILVVEVEGLSRLDLFYA